MHNREQKARLDLINIDQAQDIEQKLNTKYHDHWSKLHKYSPLRIKNSRSSFIQEHAFQKRTSNLLKKPYRVDVSCSLPQLLAKRVDQKKKLKQIYQNLSRNEELKGEVTRVRKRVNQRSKESFGSRDIKSIMHQVAEGFPITVFIPRLTIRRRTVVDSNHRSSVMRNITPYD